MSFVRPNKYVGTSIYLRQSAPAGLLHYFAEMKFDRYFKNFDVHCLIRFSLYGVICQTISIHAMYIDCVYCQNSVITPFITFDLN